MLPKKRRISGSGFAGAVSGKSFRSDFGSIRVVPDSQGLAVSVIVPKSRVKTAVARNRLRRVIYADVAKLLSEKNLWVKIFIYPTVQVLKLRPSNRQKLLGDLFVSSRLIK